MYECYVQTCGLVQHPWLFSCAGFFWLCLEVISHVTSNELNEYRRISSGEFVHRQAITHRYLRLGDRYSNKITYSLDNTISVFFAFLYGNASDFKAVSPRVLFGINSNITTYYNYYSRLLSLLVILYYLFLCT